MNEWTAERIAALAIDKVKSLRDNAKRLGSNGVVELCDLDLTQRAESRRSRRLVSTPTKSKSAFVIGFHFVCPDEKGVPQSGRYDLDWNMGSRRQTRSAWIKD